VFAEKVSGAKTDRAAAGQGNTTRDLLNTLAAVAETGATFRSLGVSYYLQAAPFPLLRPFQQSPKRNRPFRAPSGIDLMGHAAL
jgi:hypothetical protein